MSGYVNIKFDPTRFDIGDRSAREINCLSELFAEQLEREWNIEENTDGQRRFWTDDGQSIDICVGTKRILLDVV